MELKILKLQIQVLKIFKKFNPGELYYKVDVNGHKAGERYYADEKDVNGNPPKELLEHDKELVPYNYQVIDKK